MTQTHRRERRNAYCQIISKIILTKKTEVSGNNNKKKQKMTISGPLGMIRLTRNANMSDLIQA